MQEALHCRLDRSAEPFVAGTVAVRCVVLRGKDCFYGVDDSTVQLQACAAYRTAAPLFHRVQVRSIDHLRLSTDLVLPVKGHFVVRKHIQVSALRAKEQRLRLAPCVSTHCAVVLADIVEEFVVVRLPCVGASRVECSGTLVSRRRQHASGTETGPFVHLLCHALVVCSLLIGVVDQFRIEMLLTA